MIVPSVFRSPRFRNTLAVVPCLAFYASVVKAEEFKTKAYGYIDAYAEKVFDELEVDDDGKTVKKDAPHEFDVPNINLMVNSSYGAKYRGFLNLAAPGGEEVSVSNAWVEADAIGQFLKFRFGKMYRRFGLYNEKLDAVPTYIGIEPPEMFDKDHLMLTRRTNAMVHGSVNLGANTLSYALMTGKDEKEGDQMPLGLDVRFDLSGMFLIGMSYYNTNGKAVSSKENVGEGSPDGGVLPWMAYDEYTVMGFFTQLTFEGIIAELATYQADHKAKRDPEKVKMLAGEVNEKQAERMGLDDGDIEEDANYKVDTTYVRVGYAFDMMGVELTPYAQYDAYSNPETIKNKKMGGDNEAGLADDNKFSKQTLGVVVRPEPFVAFKVDASQHTQKFNGKTESYPEVRGSFSFIWQL